MARLRPYVFLNLLKMHLSYLGRWMTEFVPLSILRFNEDIIPHSILRFSLPPDPPLRKMECMYLSDGTFVIMVMITFLTGYFGRETGREISASCKIHFLNTSIHPAKIFDDAMKNQVMLLTKLENNTSGSFLVLGRMRCFEAIFGVIQPSLKCRFYAGIKRH